MLIPLYKPFMVSNIVCDTTNQLNIITTGGEGVDYKTVKYVFKINCQTIMHGSKQVKLTFCSNVKCAFVRVRFDSCHHRNCCQFG